VKRFYLIAAILLMLAGCSDDSKRAVAVDGGKMSKNIRMERGKTYQIQKGDQIEKISENPELKIDSNLTSGKSMVTLLKGEAAIIREE